MKEVALKSSDATNMNVNPLDAVQIGDFYLVKFDKDDICDRFSKNKEHIEILMCVESIGSNFFQFTIFNGRGTNGIRVHFDEYTERCRFEPNWKAILNQRMEDAGKAIQQKTQELIKAGQELNLIHAPQVEAPHDENQSFLPAKVSIDPKAHSKELVTFKESLPQIQKEIEQLGEEFAVAAKNLALPDLSKMGAVRKALNVIDDRIFTIELYCGLQENVERIAKGEPAPISTPVAIHQQILYMDEETLFNYEDGGMDFNDIKKFDEWVVKPENLERLLPDQRGIVAFRVRRKDKDYGRPVDLMTAWAHIQWAEANRQTYLLIRNGGNVYRIASEVDFEPRLIPKLNEIGAEQFKKIDKRYDFNTHKDVIVKETKITPDHIEYDDHVQELDDLLKHYNRIVILIQGLMDRSMVFHPHPPINLCRQDDMEKWVVLIRDEERGLPSNKVTWEEYHKQINSTLRKDKWIYIDSAYDERWGNGENPNYPGRRYEERPRRGWATSRMPRLCKVVNIKRDGSAVKVMWPKGERSTPKKIWVPSETRPGWGHDRLDYSTDRMCQEWIPTDRVFNVSDYNLGDYKMFICDRALQGIYLKWAKYLLNAEDWARNRAKGLLPENDPKAQISYRGRW